MHVFVCGRDIYVCLYAYTHIQIRVYVCVYVCTHRNTHGTVLTGSTKGQLPPAQTCSLWSSTSAAPRSAVRMENSLRVAARSGADHCLMRRYKTTMVLSGRLEEPLDPALCSSELRGAGELPAARPLLAPKCSMHLFLPHTQFAYVEEK